METELDTSSESRQSVLCHPVDFLTLLAGIRLEPDAEVRSPEANGGEVLAVCELKHPTTLGLFLDFLTYSMANLREHAATWLHAFPPEVIDAKVHGALMQVLFRWISCYLCISLQGADVGHYRHNIEMLADRGPDARQTWQSGLPQRWKCALVSTYQRQAVSSWRDAGWRRTLEAAVLCCAV